MRMYLHALTTGLGFLQLVLIHLLPNLGTCDHTKTQWSCLFFQSRFAGQITQNVLRVNNSDIIVFFVNNHFFIYFLILLLLLCFS